PLTARSAPGTDPASRPDALPISAQTGLGAGMSATASYAVLGAYASFWEGVSVGGKLQVDTVTPRLTRTGMAVGYANSGYAASLRSEEHTSELQSRENLVCRLLRE